MIICPFCKHITTLKRPFCIYCGCEIPSEYIKEFLAKGLDKKIKDENMESKYPFVDYQLDEDYIEDYE